jgi:hypothetical protein
MQEQICLMTIPLLSTASTAWRRTANFLRTTNQGAESLVNQPMVPHGPAAGNADGPDRDAEAGAASGGVLLVMMMPVMMIVVTPTMARPSCRRAAAPC